MPGFDGTGPLGLGPMTGRGMGYCAIPLPGPGAVRIPYGYAGAYQAAAPITHPYNTPYGYPHLVRRISYIPFGRPRFGFGFSRGRGRGFGRGWFGFNRGRGRWLLGW